MEAARLLIRKAVMLAAALMVLAAPNCPAAAPAGPDWRTLFDGQSIAGWQQIGPGGFELINGELVTKGGMGLLLYTREKLSNTQVRIVFKLNSTNDNTGLFIRIPEIPRDP